MRLLNLTLATPELNLALDEALLLEDNASDTLRFWESPDHYVVLGRSSPHAEEVDLQACQQTDAPVLRRVSGGATIVTGPGCLMYAVTLDLSTRPELGDLTKAHHYVLARLAEGLRAIDPTVDDSGTSDLTLRRDGALLKFSGNSLRKARGRLLYHGTLLYDFDLPLIARLLRTAPRQPDYREQRDHSAFVANLNTTRDDLIACLASQWNAVPAAASESVLAVAERLAEEKYTLPEWNESR